MPTSAPGSDTAARPSPPARGFTLIELLVVVAIVALSASLISLALRDGDASLLERDGQRLATLLETARAESRASGVAVLWVPQTDEDNARFRFVGLPEARQLPEHWLDQRVRAQVVGDTRVSLGPEALIGAQRIVLRLEQQRLELVTDGLGPFAIVSPS